MKNRLWMVLVVLILFSLACNLGAALGNSDEAALSTGPAATSSSQGDTPSPTQGNAISPTPADTTGNNSTQPAPTESSEQVSQSLFSDLLDVSTLSPAPFGSYSQAVTINYQGEDANGAPLLQNISITIKIQDQPEPGEGLLVIGTKGEVVQTIDSVSLGGTSYTVSTGNSCITSSENSSMRTLLGGLDRPDSNLVNEAKLVEQDIEVNGIRVDRYSLTNDNFLIENPSGTAPLEGLVVEEGSLFVARQGGYPVRMEISGNVTADGLNLPIEFPAGKNVKVDIVFDIVEAPGGTWSLAIPAGCEALASEGAGYPIMDDAANKTEIQGQVMYSTNHTPEEVIEFYRTEMPAQGWTSAGEYLAEGFSTLDFTKDGVKVGVNILGTSGQIAVTIIPKE